MGSALQPPFLRAVERVGSPSEVGLLRLSRISTVTFAVFYVIVGACFITSQIFKLKNLHDAVIPFLLTALFINACQQLRKEWKERAAARAVL